jgi:hypothetical protein
VLLVLGFAQPLGVRARLVPSGFPEVVVVRNTRRLWATATPALAKMRPRAALKITLSGYESVRGDGAGVARGRLARLLRDQSRVRQLTLAGESYAHNGRINLANELFSPTCPPRHPLARCNPLTLGNLLTDDGADGNGKLGIGDSPPDATPSLLLVACEELDMRAVPLTWNDTGVDLLLQLVPNLTRFDCAQFSGERSWLLVRRLPHLVTLRIQGDDERATRAFEYGIADRLLRGLPALRSLALPYAIVSCSELVPAADRLETLEVRVLIDDIAGLVMTRLRHLRAHIHCHQTRHLLGAFPAVGSGRLTLMMWPTGMTAANSSHSPLVARISATLDGVGGVAWSYEPPATHADNVRHQLERIGDHVGGVLSEWRSATVDHRFADSVPARLRDDIVALAAKLGAIVAKGAVGRAAAASDVAKLDAVV